MIDLQARIKTMPFHIHRWGSESTSTIEKCIVIPINPCFEVQGSSKHLSYVTSHDVLLGNPTPTLPKKQLDLRICLPRVLIPRLVLHPLGLTFLLLNVKGSKRDGNHRSRE